MPRPIALALAAALLVMVPAVTAGCSPAEEKATATPDKAPPAPAAQAPAAKAPTETAQAPKRTAVSKTPGKVDVKFVGKPRLLPKKKTPQQ
ncbi:MAG: hypothetical protein ACK46X_11550 [Candidatus Sericytochromatia bacterium]